MNSIKVMICDDHCMVREGIKQLLELDGDIEVIAEANDGEECLNMIDKVKPDVLLLDINMPKLNGLKVLESLSARSVKYRVLVLTIHNEVDYLIKSMDIGVDGYVLKDSDSSVLKKAIFSVYNGEKYIQYELVPLLEERMERRMEEVLSDDKTLTRREVEVLKLLTEGLFNKEIAYHLSISEKTVKNHVSNIFKKISVSDRTQAAVYAIKNNIVELF